MLNSATMPAVTKPTFRDRVLGCWIGKAVGGTLGLPIEGREGPHDLTFYDPVPTEMLPNDDLDLQVLWACVLDREAKPVVHRETLGQAWLDHVAFPWDEYGIAIRNLRLGLKPPMTGTYDNFFTRGMGAAIRSEIWACLAPGNPELAARFAYEDACVDHAGDGIWAEVYFAALEAAAFSRNYTQEQLLDLAEAALPVDSEVRQAMANTRNWWAQTHDWKRVRQQILDKYEVSNFTDVVMNLAFTILGWLAGEGDFSRSICIAANCGKDTDCTAATVGAIMGILDPSCIEPRWLAPIGRDLVLNAAITGIRPPKTLDGFTDLVVDLANRVSRDTPAFAAATGELPFVNASIAFLDAMPVDPASIPPGRPIKLTGANGQLPAAKFEKSVAVFRYRPMLETSQRIRVMANATAKHAVWFDGQHFARNEGPMAPSFHRLWERMFIDVDCAAGPHDLIIAIERPSPGKVAEWTVGLADAASHQWLPRALHTT